MIEHEPSERPTAKEVQDLFKNTEGSELGEGQDFPTENSSDFIPICDNE